MALTQKQRIDKAIEVATKKRDAYAEARVKELAKDLKEASDSLQRTLADLDASDALKPYQQNRAEAIRVLQSQIDTMQKDLETKATLGVRDSVNGALELGIDEGIDQLKAWGVPSFTSLDPAATTSMAQRIFATIDIQAVDFLANYQVTLLGDVSRQLAANIKGAVTRGILEGSSIPDIRREIGRVVVDKEAFRTAGKTIFKTAQQRMTLIARTETLRAHNEGRKSFYADAGITEVTWITADDDRTCPICLPRNGVVYKLKDLDGPPAHPDCLLPGIMVVADGIKAATKRWYSGDVVEIKTSGGAILTVTPNHPILTSAGWKPAGEFRAGDDLVCAGLDESAAPSSCVVDDQDMPSGIEEIFDALRLSDGMATVEVPAAPVQFHGDGTVDGQVDVVLPRRLLLDDLCPSGAEPTGHEQFCRRCKDRLGLDGAGGSLLFGVSLDAPPGGLMGGRSESKSLFSRCPSHSGEHSSGSIPWSDVGSKQPTPDHATGDGVRLAKRLLGFSGKIPCNEFFDGDLPANRFDDPTRNNASLNDPPADNSGVNTQRRGNGTDRLSCIVPCDNFVHGKNEPLCHLDSLTSVVVSHYSGYVFNLETLQGWYIGNGIVSSNCRCSVSARVPEEWLSEEPAE
jgi:SPP1 gp7 family putative phage head morphogenesis protein